LAIIISMATLSTNAVELMVKGSPMAEPHVVEVYPMETARPNYVWMCDGKKQSIAALWLFPDRLDHPMTVRIKGYISSRSNAGQTDPIVAIGDVEHLGPIHSRKPQTQPYAWTQDCRGQGGRISTFIKEFGSFLTVDQLAGKTLGSRSSSSSSSSSSWEDQLRSVTDFFALNHAMHKLHAQSPNSSTEVYMKVIEQFQESQWDRQSTSLSTNAGRESAELSAKIVSQHKTALQHALSCGPVLSVAKLNVIHSFLCDGLVEDAGLIRRKNVRVGTTSFCHHDTLAQTIMDALSNLSTLEGHLFRQDHHQDTAATVALLVYTAAVLLTVVDVHPYADGNGRLARICLNWALSVKGNCPFVVHLFSTPTQRQSYTDAIRKTRRNCDLQAFGTATKDMIQSLHPKIGCLFPMVDLILDRLHKAVTECTRLLNDKTSQKLQDEEEQAARRFRERAAAGSCLICFEDNPNIATLCCGKAVHLNCMAEWLSSQTSCPQCRATLPSIPERMRRNDEESTDWENVGTGSTMDSMAPEDTTDLEVHLFGVDNDNVALDDGNDTTMEDYYTTEDATEEESDETTEQEAEDAAQDEETAEDETPQAENHRQQSLPPFCLYCRNRAAKDCSNTCCGRCCVAHGHYHCSRHTT
jgi:fido (protein-threonine AMPylation protein)